MRYMLKNLAERVLGGNIKEKTNFLTIKSRG